MYRFSDRSQRLQYRLRTKIAELRRSMQTRMSSVRRAMNERLGRLEETIVAVVLKFRPAWQSYAYAMIRQAQVANMAVQHHAEEFAERLQEHKANLYEMLDDKFDHITYKVENFLEKLAGEYTTTLVMRDVMFVT